MWQNTASAQEIGHLLHLLCVDLFIRDNMPLPGAAYAALGVHALDCMDGILARNCCTPACSLWECALAITFVDSPCTWDAHLCFSILGLAAACS